MTEIEFLIKGTEYKSTHALQHVTTHCNILQLQVLHVHTAHRDLSISSKGTDNSIKRNRVFHEATKYSIKGTKLPPTPPPSPHPPPPKPPLAPSCLSPLLPASQNRPTRTQRDLHNRCTNTNRDQHTRSTDYRILPASQKRPIHTQRNQQKRPTEEREFVGLFSCM